MAAIIANFVNNTTMFAIFFKTATLTIFLASKKKASLAEMQKLVP